jgi:Ca2+-binding RTX toxin-like protein
MPSINLSGNYGYTPYSASNLASYTTINASLATWIVANCRNSNPDYDTLWSEGSGQLNTYPFKISGAGTGLVLLGGTVWGEVPQTSDWEYTYNNSAALRIEAAPNMTIDEWRIDKAWDAIRIATGTTNWLVDDTYLSNVRDDAIEDDYLLSGTVRDSLFDGVYSGISLANSSGLNGSASTITLEGAFIRHETYLVRGEMTHGSLFKANESNPGATPNIRIINSVIAIEDPDHNSQGRLDVAWDHVIESHGNVFLNLSDTPLSSDYPLPPSGFTILQGQVARDYWAACKAAWLDNHDGTSFADITPLPPLPGATVAPTPPPPTTTTTTSAIMGTSASETLTGSLNGDTINGAGGNDLIFGKLGNDVLTGGSGTDKFVFDTKPGIGNVDRITDFDTAHDYIYLDNAIFTTIGSGSFSSPKRLYGTYFESGVGVKADDSNDHILYDTGSGALSYDADGNGSLAPVQIAQLSPGLDLSHWDFFVV